MTEELISFVRAVRVLRVGRDELQGLVERGELQLFCYEGVNMFRRDDVLRLRNQMDRTGELAKCSGGRAAALVR